MDYRLIESKDIDKHKWNLLINESENSSIFFESYTLDVLANQLWSAVVIGDYDAVIPLPYKSVIGMKVLYMPAFIPRLGVMGNDQVDYNKIGKILKDAFRVLLYTANFELNICDAQIKTNYYINLGQEYDFLRKNYNASVHKNLNKARNRKATIVENIEVATIIQFYQKAYGHLAKIKNEYYNCLHTIANFYLQKNGAFTIGVKNENGALVYGALFFQDKNRIYYLLAAPTEEGRFLRAAYLCIDYVLQKYAGRNLLFDFEGSDIPNVAQFYKAFNPNVEHYYFHKKEAYWYKHFQNIKKLLS